MLTPQIKTNKLAKKIGLPVDLYFKREDLHPYGSHKGRSIPLMIEKYTEKGARHFAISSSGNAALAAGLYINEYNKKHEDNLSLTIFVGKNIDPEKMKNILALSGKNIKITQSANPKQSAFQMEKTKHAKNLRQSTDDSALLGYEDLAKELSKIKNLSAVFIPTSSGTMVEGLHNGFKKMRLNPQIHIIQTEACHPIAETVLGVALPKKKTSIASAIVDKVAHRKKQVVKIIKNSGGGAWVPNEKEISEAKKIVKNTENIDISPNSALAVAGLNLAVKSKQKFTGPVICLITGQ